MTTGLLISWSNKLKLHKIALTDNVPYNWTQYRNYRNVFNKTVRASKKLYYLTNIEKNAKNQKKTWDILRELITGKTDQVQLDKINVNGKTISEPLVMANEFNSFFTIGWFAILLTRWSPLRLSLLITYLKSPPHPLGLIMSLNTRLWTLSALWNQNLVLIQAELI